MGLIVAGCAGGGDGTTDSHAALASKPKVDAFIALAAKHGVTATPGRALAIGIRGQDTSGARHPTKVAQAFDDRLVVLAPDGSLFEVPTSTHPWRKTGTSASGVPDVDGDGQPDVGMILPGNYTAVRRAPVQNIASESTYAVATTKGSGRIPGIRNVDHDDTYSPAERTSSLSRGDGLTDVLFHVGSDAAPPVVGCQVLSPEDMNRLTAVGGARFDYLLVDANDEDVPQP